MNGRRSKAIRRLAGQLRPENPRWAARWLRRHRGRVDELPERATVTRWASWLRVIWAKSKDTRKGSFKRTQG